MEFELITAAAEFPAVMITGPKGAGKTTLVKQCFPNHAYVNLEHPAARALAMNDPKALLAEHTPPVIIDEIQYAPQLLTSIRDFIDHNPEEHSLFIITANRTPGDMAETLGSSTALFTLMPLSFQELPALNDAPHMILQGSMPEVHQRDISPVDFWGDYFQTFIERDLRNVLTVRNQSAFMSFITCAAQRTSMELNYRIMAQEAGVSAVQIKKWVSVLQDLCIIFTIPPYYQDFGKRLTQSPKCFFCDAGLAAYLMHITSAQQLEAHPRYEALFENLVVSEALKSRCHKGESPSLYYFREHNTYRIQLLYPSGSEHIPVEITSSDSFTSPLLAHLNYYKKISGTRSAGMVVYTGEDEMELEHARVRNFAKGFTL